MTLKEEMQKTRDDAIMTKEEVTEMVQKVKAVFKEEQKKDKTKKDFNFKLYFDYRNLKLKMETIGPYSGWSIWGNIDTEAKLQWLFRKLERELQVEGIQVDHNFDENEKAETDSHKRIVCSYYSMKLS